MLNKKEILAYIVLLALTTLLFYTFIYMAYKVVYQMARVTQTQVEEIL